jgi:FKBP12-rapamycin complex-associated protein
MAQAGPVTDVVQRLFTELKSKNEDARVKASYELYENVLTVSRGNILTATILFPAS